MGPIKPPTNGEPPKSWKKINEERKALKKQRKQEKLLKSMAKEKVAEEEANSAANAERKPFPSTVSIGVPGSILENAQSAELATYVAGQIARAACIFRVNEVIVFDDIGVATARETKRNYEADETGADGEVSQTVRSSSLQLARILQYLECPQYLRKFFFPLHKDLKYSGLLNPLDTPHHLRQQSAFQYREGIVTEKKAKDGFCYVNVGLLNDVLVKMALTPGVRVTVRLENPNETSRKLRGDVVGPDEPRREVGVYWGYTVRIAHSISEIFTKSPYAGGYDLTVGTSDRGQNVHEVESRSLAYSHALIVFGGLKGLEEALANDDKLNVDDPAALFDHYVNVLPKQGSRTIRTEEAVLIALSSLGEKLKANVEEVDMDLSEYLPRSEDTGAVLNQGHTNKKLRKDKRHEPRQEEAGETESQQDNGNKNGWKHKNGENDCQEEGKPMLKRPFDDKDETKATFKKSFNKKDDDKPTFNKSLNQKDEGKPPFKKSFNQKDDSKPPFKKSFGQKDEGKPLPKSPNNNNPFGPKDEGKPPMKKSFANKNDAKSPPKSSANNPFGKKESSPPEMAYADDDLEVVPATVGAPGSAVKPKKDIGDLSRFD